MRNKERIIPFLEVIETNLEFLFQNIYKMANSNKESDPLIDRHYEYREKIREFWLKNPDLRFVQVLVKFGFDIPGIEFNIEDDTVLRYFKMKEEKRKRYKLIKEYPNSPKLGTTFSVLENDKIKNYPEFWQPISDIKEDIIKLASELGFKSVIHNPYSADDTYWLFYMTELQRWLRDKYKLYISTSFVDHERNLENNLLSSLKALTLWKKAS